MTNESDIESNDNATGTTVSRRSSRIAKNASEVDENTSLTPSNRVTRSRMRDGDTSTRSGRVSRPTPKFAYGIFGETRTFTTEEIDYYNALVVLKSFNDTNQAGSKIVDQSYEVAGVGAGTGNNFGNTAELKPMKYKEAMKCDDKKLWEEAVDEDYRKFEKYKVFKPVKKNEVPKDAKFVTTTWAMKRKSNGVRRARMNMRGYEQEENVHYDPSATAAPVTNDVTIRMMLTLAIMAGWVRHIIDVKGAFLHGEFENGEVIYTKIPEGFEKFWDPNAWIWLLQKTSYGLIQAAVQFWKTLLKAIIRIMFKSICNYIIDYGFPHSKKIGNHL